VRVAPLLDRVDELLPGERTGHQEALGTDPWWSGGRSPQARSFAWLLSRRGVAGAKLLGQLAPRRHRLRRLQLIAPDALESLGRLHLGQPPVDVGAETLGDRGVAGRPRPTRAHARSGANVKEPARHRIVVGVDG
jgi:hypothetical protein